MTQPALVALKMPSELAGLELSPRGTRFLDPATEAEYLRWQAAQSLPLNRSSLVGGFVLGLVQAVAFAILSPGGFLPWLAPIGLLQGIGLWTLIASRRPSSSRWIQPIGAVINALSGHFTVAILSLHLHLPDIAFAAAVAISFIAFAVNRFRPWQAALSAASFCTLELALTAQGFRVGELSTAQLVLPSLMLPALFGSGLQTAIVVDVGLRNSFRQQRIIERQKEIISHERARTEGLLKQEISHQVAERSRELGEAFAKADLSLPTATLIPGRLFAGRYTVIGPLGRGGMGAVHEVERLTDQRRFALKVVTGDITGPQAARFAREAEIGARLRHRNLVQIVDVGVSEVGAPFLVMELVAGDGLEARRKEFGDVRWALPVLRQIAAGLAALHEAGVVHRDLKPANVLLSGDPAAPLAQISDFGISRFGAITGEVDPLGETVDPTSGPKAHSLTRTGALIGTPLYMAPEAARGAQAVDTPADVFAFGIVAYELLAGRMPFVTPPVMDSLGGRPLSPPAALTDLVEGSIASAVLACLSADPVNRPTIRQVLDTLGAG